MNYNAIFSRQKSEMISGIKKESKLKRETGYSPRAIITRQTIF